MTVCIGAICENGRVAVVASDRMVTGQMPPIQFEHPKPKIDALSNYCAVLSAGNALKPIEIKNKSSLIFAERGRPPSVEEMADIVKSCFQFCRAEEAEDLFIKPRTISKETFYTEGIRILPHDLFAFIDNEFTNYDLGIQMMVVGVDSSAHIYSIEHPGVVSCFDTIGFHAIGIGTLHAIQAFVASQYNTTCNLTEALSIVYLAKKRAEVAPGVGVETDISIIKDGQIIPLEHELIKKLSEAYEQVQQPIFNQIKESGKLLEDFMNKGGVKNDKSKPENTINERENC